MVCQLSWWILYEQSVEQEDKKRRSADDYSSGRRSHSKYMIPWNKGKTGLQVAWNKGLTKEDPRVQKYAKEGHPNYNTELKGCFKKGNIPWSKGKGKERYWNNPLWHELRKYVYARDNYTCLSCGKVGGRLTMHHLMPASLFPEYIYEEKNIITLCVKCHTFTDTWGLRLVRKRDEFRERLSQLTLSQVREETLEKVQRLVAEASVNDHASNRYHEPPARKGRDSLNLQATVRCNG